MRNIAINLAIAGALLALTIGPATPASTTAIGCHDKQSSQGSASLCGTSELAAQSKRPRITIYRRSVYPRPNAVRQCYSWLQREYRVSGPVIVPQMRCWWE
jgi:hypothetical protein